MKEINVAELKQIQLDILTDIHQFCEDNHLTYFLDYGSLIGAIRHNGFIPWDDDIDISMPRPDYEKFIHTYRNRTDFKVFEHTIDADYHLPFAKVANTRTVMNEYMYKQDSFGVYVDVFPIDGVANVKQQFAKLHRLSHFLNTKKAVLSLKTRSFSKNLIILLGKTVLTGISTKKIINLIAENATKRNFEEASLVANLVSEPFSDKEVFSKDSVTNVMNHVFENRTFKIPVDYHNRLTVIYGDYMQFPPEEQRKSTHSFYAYWKD